MEGKTLKAETQNLAGLFAGNPTYKIPVYQRPYAWDKNIWSGLAGDFKNLHAKTKPQYLPNGELSYLKHAGKTPTKHFVGALVMHHYNDSAKEFHIVDGQQRITTMLLMVAGLINAIMRINKTGIFLITEEDNIKIEVEAEEQVIHALKSMLLLEKIAWKDRNSKSADSHTLRLSKKDKDLYIKVIEQALSGEPSLEKYLDLTLERVSNTDKNKIFKKSLIENCFCYFSDFFEDYLRGSLVAMPYDTAYQLSFIESVANTLRECFHFAVITVDRSEKPQEIFESLNARSRPLESFDLIKNLVLMEVGALRKEEEDIDAEERVNEEYSKNWEHYEIDNFWDEIQSTSRDIHDGDIIDNKIVFLNYWLDANYDNSYRGLKERFSDLDDGGSSFAQFKNLTEKNTDLRFKSRDAVFWDYRIYINFLKETTDSENHIGDFSDSLNRDAKFFSQAVKAIKNEIIYSEHYDKEEYSILHELSQSYNVPLLLSFIERIIQGLEQRALWKQVLWLIKKRTDDKKISREEFSKYINVLDSWATRRFFLPNYKVQDLNTATVYLVKHMIQKEFFCDKQGEHGKAVAILAGTALEGILAGKNDKAYLSWPTDHEILSNEYSARISLKENLTKAKHIFTAIENHERGFVDFGKRLLDENATAKRLNAKDLDLLFILPSNRVKKKWSGPIKTAEKLFQNENLNEEERNKLAQIRSDRQKSIGNLILVNLPQEESSEEDEKNDTKDMTSLSLPIHNNWSERKEYIISNLNHPEIIISAEILTKSEWGVSEIETTSIELLKKMIKIWPRPE